MSYQYHEPAAWADALAVLAAHGDEAIVLAGGTAFTLLLRQGLIRPSAVVALRRIPGASRVGIDAHGRLSIGTTATHSAVAHSAEVRRTWPELAEAVATVATLRVRNQATVGGSVAHADPASDAPVMLAALGAEIVVLSQGPGEPARVPIEELIVDTFSTSLAPTDLIHSIEVPRRDPATRAAYLKYTLRSVDDYATVSVGASAVIADGRFRDLRIFLGAVGPKPMRAVSVERALEGQPAEPRLLRDAAGLVRGDIDPIDDVRGAAEYKRGMARVFTERALRRLVS
jgi:carbon-monoxide dehydrogenase medium subunit